MLQQRYRLRRSADLQRLRQQGQSLRHPLIILLVQPNDQPISRFAFVASRYVGKAVARNRAKRLLREVIRHHLHEVASGWNCLFIARSAMRHASYIEVETAVLQLLSRAHLLKTTS